MPATVNSVTREIDASGREINAYEADDGSRVQGVALNPEIMGELLVPGRTGTTPVKQENAKATAGRLFRASVILIAAPAALDRWMLVVDKATAAVNTDPAIWRSPKLAGDFSFLDFGNWALEFSAGCQLVLSSTPDKVTLVVANDGFFQWQTD
jgi:hypothetical protein